VQLQRIGQTCDQSNGEMFVSCCAIDGRNSGSKLKFRIRNPGNKLTIALGLARSLDSFCCELAWKEAPYLAATQWQGKEGEEACSRAHAPSFSGLMERKHGLIEPGRACLRQYLEP